MKIKYLLLTLIAFSTNTNLFSQIFTKITDPVNPIITEQLGSGGGSWIDINNDNLLDLFVPNGNLNSQNNSLFLNTGNGNFIKVSTGNMVEDGGSSIGSTWGDFNNDGYIDCFVTNRNNFGNFLYMGNGDTAFTKIVTGSIVTDIANSNSSSWVDADNDGLLDLYVVNFFSSDLFYKGGGLPNHTFTSQAPINSGSGYSIPGAWSDYNNDLLPDLFIGNAGNQNDFLYTNNGSLAFTETIINDANTTLGASWADYDNDGDLDLFAGNYLNNANILYQNSGAPSFTLTPVSGSSVSTIGNTVGSAWGDVDNDGDLDLFIADDGGNNNLFLNDGFPNYTFTAAAMESAVSDGGNSFGCVLGDYNNDGQLDLFVANQMNQENFLYQNNGNSNHWVTIKCQGITSNRSGIGAKVFLKAVINGNPTWQMQEVVGQTGYNSENLWLHFGLGQSTIIDSIIVKWPSGQIDNCENIVPDTIYEAVEGLCLETGIRDFENNLKVTFSISPNPFSQETKIEYRLPKNENIKICIYNLLGEIVKTILNEKQQKGFHEINITSTELNSGLYFFEIQTENFKAIKKIILEK